MLVQIISVWVRYLLPQRESFISFTRSFTEFCSKENTKSVVGPAGIREMLLSLADHDKEGKVKTVCIGGINASTAQRVLYQSRSLVRQLDGIAVVSAIVGAEDPKSAAKQLRIMVDDKAPWASHTPAESRNPITKDTIKELVPIIVKHVAETTPLCHNMTNLVVQNFAANVALCIGGSPIMSNNGVEAPDLAKHGGSLVINMGTVTGDMLKNYTQAVQAYNAVGGPVLLDPVGAGASQPRKDAAKLLMGSGYFDVMKGNFSEIATLAGVSTAQQRGVDSSAVSSSMDEKVAIVRALAERERNIVVMTGAIDIVSDGARTLVIQNGHEYLGNITGSGCTLGTTIAAFVATYKEDKMLAAIAGMLIYEIAAERAAVRDDVRGPGTFVPALLDELYAIRKMAENDDVSWIESAKVRYCEGGGSPKSIRSN
jgi:thiamine-phosphate diphosphorylase/hydroxyethylthiazole kinase